MKKLFISDLEKYFTQTIETSFFLKEIITQESSVQKIAFFKLSLQDSSGTIPGIIWDNNMNPDYLNFRNKIVKIKGIVTKQSNILQIIINSMKLITDFDPTDYMNGISEECTNNQMDILFKYIDGIKSNEFKKLCTSIFKEETSFPILPATLKGHHNFNGGLLIYTLGTTSLAIRMAKNLQCYNIHPSHSIPYNYDILATAGLLHCIGSLKMLTPFPNMGRIINSVPLSLHELTFQYLTTKILVDEIKLTEEEQYLLFHTIGCVYESDVRKPMTREALLLREASHIQIDISSFEHFLFKNYDKQGIVYDTTLNNYLYASKEEVNKNE